VCISLVIPTSLRITTHDSEDVKTKRTNLGARFLVIMNVKMTIIGFGDVTSYRLYGATCYLHLRGRRHSVHRKWKQLVYSNETLPKPCKCTHRQSTDDSCGHMNVSATHTGITVTAVLPSKVTVCCSYASCNASNPSGNYESCPESRHITCTLIGKFFMIVAALPSTLILYL
jgi:hypothetical protein